ncbi:hypothetical protein [Planctomycetes bacterium K23_9]|uniref:Glycosyltransferase RgtA/B/C/D-like domain-containing protein n=1 Tax=Stieleria marina TaxID=1930275 RepID=A0A517NYZ2_9BACT|nr:hypothetical protein K239x_43500 [Planctomycetes bacterium K23_9]
MSSGQLTAGAKYQLQATLPENFALRSHHAATVGAFVVLFLYFGYLPVTNPSTWDAALSEQSGSQVTQLLPLSEGIRHIEIGAAGKRLIAMLHSWGGSEMLSLSFAVLQTMTLAIWAAIFLRLSDRRWAAMGVVVVVVASFPFLNGLTAATFGQLVFAALAYCLSRTRARTEAPTIASDLKLSSASYRLRATMVVLFCVWANLHGSFVVGLGWLGTLVAARFLTTVGSNGLRESLFDEEFKSRVWLLELATLATLLTPSGVQLWAAMCWWPDNPVLQELGGIAPTVMTSWIGVSVLLLWASVAIGTRNRNVNLAWLLPPALLTVATGFSSPMIVWFAPLMMASIFAVLRNSENDAKHPSITPDENCDDKSAGQVGQKNETLRFGFTLLAGLLLWFGFAFSPWASVLLGGKSRSETQLTGSQYPHEAVSNLTSHGDHQLLFCPAEWSDWIQAQSATPVFVNSDTSRFPSSVQSDYSLIYRGENNWKSVAEKYALSHILIDRQQQKQLVRRFRQTPGDWRIQYEDKDTILLVSEATQS